MVIYDQRASNHLFGILIPIDFVAEGLAQIISQSCYIIVSIMKVIIITIPSPILQCSWTAENSEEKKRVGKIKYQWSWKGQEHGRQTKVEIQLKRENKILTLDFFSFFFLISTFDLRLLTMLQ